MSTDIRERVRSRAAGKKRGKPKVERTYPPELAEFAQDVRVLAFDQTLTKTAWIMVAVSGGEIIVHDRGMIRQQTGRTGFMETYDKAWQFQQNVGSLWYAVQAGDYPAPDAIVAEYPAVYGHRTESSLMAGYILHQTFGGEINWIGAQHAKSVLGGKACKEKSDLKPVLAQLHPDSATRQWNEDQRDALANALTYLWDRKVGSR